MFAEMVMNAAGGTVQPDYTPAVIGFVGTLFGATIGLAFNSFSHREQKRRHVNEKIVELLRHTDGVYAAYNNIYSLDLDDDRSREAIAKRKAESEVRASEARGSAMEAKLALDYIGLVADRKTFGKADDVRGSSVRLLDKVTRYLSGEEALRFEARFGYDDARKALVSHLSPNEPAPNSPSLLWLRFSKWAARHEWRQPVQNSVVGPGDDSAEALRSKDGEQARYLDSSGG